MQWESDVPHESAPEELSDAGERRPEDLPGVETEVREGTAVTPDEAGETAFVFRTEIAPVQGSEVAHGYHILDEYASALLVGLAEKKLVFKPEVEL